MKTTEHIAQVEACQEWLQFKEHGMHLWPCVRLACLTFLYQKLYPGSAVARSERKPGLGYAVRRLVRTMGTLPRALTPLTSRKKIWLCTSEAYLRQNEEGDWFNPVFFPIGDLYSAQTLYLDLSTQKPYVSDQKYVSRNGSYLPWLAQVYATTLGPQPSQKLLDAAGAYFDIRCRQCLDITLPRDDLLHVKSLMRHHFSVSVARKAVWKRVFTQGKPSYFCAVNAFSHMQGQIAAAHELGIHTAEMQHGLIFPHVIYLYHAQELCSLPEYSQYFPQRLFVWGKYWKDQARVPGHIEIWGNAYFESRKQTMPRGEENTILFILGSIYEPYLPIISSVAREYSVLVRPHPLFREHFAKKLAPGLPDSVRIDRTADVYDSIAQVGVVIGDESAALYEAAALGRRVFSLNAKETSHAVEGKLLAPFNTAVELLEILRGRGGGLDKNMQKELFAPFDNGNISRNFFNSC